MLLSLTINDLATQSGISESCLAQVELGSRLASADVLDRIAGPLEYEKEDLFEIAEYLMARYQSENPWMTT
jgi:transcriptional regulator with XRE-family HTH domain